MNVVKKMEDNKIATGLGSKMVNMNNLILVRITNRSMFRVQFHSSFNVITELAILVFSEETTNTNTQ
jgi:hypothetical protein